VLEKENGVVGVKIQGENIMVIRSPRLSSWGSRDICVLWLVLRVGDDDSGGIRNKMKT